MRRFIHQRYGGAAGGILKLRGRQLCLGLPRPALRLGLRLGLCLGLGLGLGLGLALGLGLGFGPPAAAAASDRQTYIQTDRQTAIKPKNTAKPMFFTFLARNTKKTKKNKIFRQNVRGGMASPDILSENFGFFVFFGISS